MMGATDSHNTYENLPPQNLDAEESVLGACLLSANAVAAVAEILTARDFYRASHGRIFDAILAVFGRGEPVDGLTVRDELERTGAIEEVGGTVRLNEIAALVPTTTNAVHYARIVSDMAALRGLVRVGQEIARLGFERGEDVPTLVDQAEAALYDVVAARSPTSDFLHIRETLRDAYAELEALHERKSDVIGLPSGLSELDKLTSGWQPGNLIVIAARPSMGKSSIALGCAAHAALVSEIPAALFTLEMSQREVTQRLLSMEGRVDSSRIRTGKLDADHWARVSRTAGRLENAPIYIDDSGALTVMEVRSKARRLKAREPRLGLVVVDYLQLMMSGKSHESRVQEVSQISRSLKVLARELDIPVIAVSQLSRSPESRHDKRPILSDLRESGAIEQDADLVIFVYRDEYYNPEDEANQGIAELHLAKHRNGPTDVVKTAFVKRLARFDDLHQPPGTGGG